MLRFGACALNHGTEGADSLRRKKVVVQLLPASGPAGWHSSIAPPACGKHIRPDDCRCIVI